MDDHNNMRRALAGSKRMDRVHHHRHAVQRQKLFRYVAPDTCASSAGDNDDVIPLHGPLR